MAFLQLLWSQNYPKEYFYTIRKSSGYYVVTDKNSGKTIIRLRIRHEYPQTFCVQRQSGEIFCGYGSISPKEDEEFLHIHFHVDGSIDIQRDLLTTLPFFYGYDGHTFIASNEYSTVWDNLSKHTLKQAIISEWLVPDVNWRRDTPCKEIHTLNELESLHFGKGKLSLRPGVSKPWGVTREAPPTRPHDFIRVLENHADSFLQRIDKDFDSVAFEMSGGLDSSFLPLYINKKYPGSVRLASSMLLTGYYYETHTEKLLALDQLIHPEWTLVSFDDPHYRPLKDAACDLRFAPRHSWTAGFEELLDKYAASLYAKGCRIILTGDGGDELFDNMINVEESLGTSKPTYQRRLATLLPPFFTKDFYTAWGQAALTSAPLIHPQLAVNLHRATSVRNYFIRHNIWPMTPFANKELYYFCQGLPIHYRANKNIFRAYYQAKRWPASIYNPRANEGPNEVLDSIYLSGYYNRLIEYFCQHGHVTNQLGYINKDILRNTLKDCFSGKIEGIERSESIFLVHLWLQTEIGLTQFSIR